MKFSYKQYTLVLILFSVLFRLFLAGNLEFGNDEVYYWLYAKYPDLSHFDHPSMVGFFIQFFTLNLYFDSELAIRLGAIIPSGICMYLIYLIANYLKNRKAGFVAVLLYNIQIYGFIIAGTFILPDSPLVLFWLLSFYFFIQVLPYEPNKNLNLKLLLAFFFSGCALYSKYQAIFLLLGVVLYVILFNKKWLKNIYFYLGFLFPLCFVFLIFYWNYSNNFISYKFHGERVSFFSFKFNKNSFLREVLGQLLYNNPYLVIMLIISIISFFKKKLVIKRKQFLLFLTTSIPLILTTTYLSLFRDTLPHWSGISYLTMLPIIAVYLYEKHQIERKLIITFCSFLMLLIVAVLAINIGLFLPDKKIEIKESLGKKDVFLDMYGWEIASKKLTKVLEDNQLTDLSIISNKWYPAAHIDYYIAKPNNMNVYGVGRMNDIHKYYWINKEKNPLKNKVLYITDSRNYNDPKILYGKEYKFITELETIPIERGGRVVKYVFLFLLEK